MYNFRSKYWENLFLALLSKLCMILGQSTKRGGVHFSLVKSMLDVILSFKRYPSKSHGTIINDMYDLYKYYCIMLFNIHHPGQGVGKAGCRSRVGGVGKGCKGLVGEEDSSPRVVGPALVLA